MAQADIQEATVIWDFNGTILDDFGLCLRSVNQMLERRGLAALSPEKYLEIFDFPVQDYYRRAGFDFTADPFTELADEYIALYQPASFACPLRRGIRDALAFFREQGIRQILLSASRRDLLQDQIRHFGLSGFFADLIGQDDILGRSKLALARDWFSGKPFQPARTVLIGDTTHDFAVASDLGCRCLLLSGGHNSRQRLLETGAGVLNEPAELIWHIVQDGLLISGNLLKSKDKDT
ncbi:MAG TPA: phosphoglycolate phosphatase [Clostridiales bacterium]|nr:phosphoglycolate phosphatase [Clostridiales bacterium]